jgi:thiamine-phosphate pyrophosphorylase
MRLPRVYPILDGALLANRGVSLAAAAEGLIEAGVYLLQLRWKEHFTRAVFDEVLQINDLCRQAGAMLIVNDRADIAVMLRAGLHLGQDDLSPSAIRSAFPDVSPVGLSTHNEVQFDAARGELVDYIALGPIFGTANKSNPDPAVGTAELARLRTRTDKPVVAIGGINRENARQVWRAGADSVAIIGDLYPECCTVTSIKQRYEEWATLASNE